MRRLAAAVVCGLLGLVAPVAAIEAYPTRPITLIVPFAPGGSTDAIGRIVAEGLRAALGQMVVVENRGGAGGSIGTAALAAAEAHGYTIGIGTASTLAINPAIYGQRVRDAVGDLAPVGLIAEVPNIMAVTPSVQAADVAGLVRLARADPGALSYASAGIGSVSHLLGEQFRLVTGVDIVHVPYKGVGPALTDVVAGQVEVIYDNLPTSLPLILDGRLRPLAVSGRARVPSLPDVPTFAEAGLEEMNWMAFFGLVAPRGTPESVVQRLNAAVADALAKPAVRDRLLAQQALVGAGSPREFGAYVERERARMAKAAAAAGIAAE